MAINIDKSTRNRAHYFSDVIDQIYNNPIFDNECILTRNACLNSNFSICFQMAPFAMNRKNILRLNDVVAVEKFASCSMARDMNKRICFMYNLGAKASQLIDNAIDRIFITGNERGGQNYCVTISNANLVVAICHTRERCHRFTL